MRPRPFLLLLAGVALALMAVGEVEKQPAVQPFIKAFRNNNEEFTG